MLSGDLLQIDLRQRQRVPAPAPGQRVLLAVTLSPHRERAPRVPADPPRGTAVRERPAGQQPVGGGADAQAAVAVNSPAQRDPVDAQLVCQQRLPEQLPLLDERPQGQAQPPELAGGVDPVLRVRVFRVRRDQHAVAAAPAGEGAARPGKPEVNSFHRQGLLQTGFGNIVEPDAQFVLPGNPALGERIDQQGGGQNLQHHCNEQQQKQYRTAFPLRKAEHHTISFPLFQGMLRGRTLLRMVMLSGPAPEVRLIKTRSSSSTKKERAVISRAIFV